MEPNRRKEGGEVRDMMAERIRFEGKEGKSKKKQ